VAFVEHDQTRADLDDDLAVVSDVTCDTFSERCVDRSPGATAIADVYPRDRRVVVARVSAVLTSVGVRLVRAGRG
jgi:hypothetical protein